MFHDLKTETRVCFLSEADTNGETPDLILNRTRLRPEQVPFPTPLPLPPCPSRRSRELHIRRLENDMIKHGAADPFLAAFIKCTNSDHSESSDADSDQSSQRSGERGSSSPSSPSKLIFHNFSHIWSTENGHTDDKPHLVLQEMFYGSRWKLTSHHESGKNEEENRGVRVSVRSIGIVVMTNRVHLHLCMFIWDLTSPWVGVFCDELLSHLQLIICIKRYSLSLMEFDRNW